MDAKETIQHYLGRLDYLLDKHFAAHGDDLAARIASIRSLLPDELLTLLQDIDKCATQLILTAGDDSAGLPDFLFRCGLACEQLDNLSQNRAAESIAALQTHVQPPVELDKTELDAIARFVATRDRMLRAVADFTLKALLFLLGLFILAAVIGLV
ncbi:hypothetical protein F6R98_01515 [Candidatus Methylospira mobilis]|uniref:Uncharacterized protein n=1 Tax=Candidatus Methylospira mobilis TaxID=1808979 RepID=A0A5Q0BGX2_9GAMM|nr:hypothetical protein [Candidatus Methylospira mobilis]QFY41461.1 hypothetical protein F6R98_01515 [Candidatus Methylospira mobilis]WNV05313.1 hypothetical protein RP726_02600 [Candidatus Methylospira mobilis]